MLLPSYKWIVLRDGNQNPLHARRKIKEERWWWISEEKYNNRPKNPKQNRLDLFVCNKGKREVTPSEIEIACQDKLQIDEGEKRSVIYLC